jgi:integrase
LYGLEDKHFVLPSIEGSKKLPVVLSQQEIRRLISAPKLLKHRLLITLAYDCGLRRGELLNLEVTDIDFDRKNYLKPLKKWCKQQTEKERFTHSKSYSSQCLVNTALMLGFASRTNA